MCPLPKPPTEAEQRQLVVSIAREWIGTPFHLNACVKGAGVSCGWFVANAFEQAGLIDRLDLPTVKQDWHLHRTDEIIVDFVKQYCVPVEDRDPLPGDIILYQYGRTLSHMAIVIDWPSIIHSTPENRGVTESDASEVSLKSRQRAVYSFWKEAA